MRKPGVIHRDLFAFFRRGRLELCHRTIRALFRASVCAVVGKASHPHRVATCSNVQMPRRRSYRHSIARQIRKGMTCSHVWARALDYSLHSLHPPFITPGVFWSLWCLLPVFVVFYCIHVRTYPWFVFLGSVAKVYDNAIFTDMPSNSVCRSIHLCICVCLNVCHLHNCLSSCLSVHVSRKS